MPDGVPGGRGDRADAGEAGESGLDPDTPRVRPRGQRDRGDDRPDPGLVEEGGRGAAPGQVGDPLGDVPELVVECCDTLGKPDRSTACGSGGEVFVACSPRGDRDDPRGGERMACVDAGTDHPQQRGERVDRRGALGLMRSREASSTSTAARRPPSARGPRSCMSRSGSAAAAMRRE